MENNYDIGIYLRDRRRDRRSTCKVCGVKIFRSKAKLESHKRSGNCTGQIGEDKDLSESKTIDSQTVRSVPSPPESVEPVPKAAKKDPASLFAHRLISYLFNKTLSTIACLQNYFFVPGYPLH